MIGAAARAFGPSTKPTDSSGVASNREGGPSIMSLLPNPRLSDLPREQRLTALYRRAAQDRARFEASRRPASMVDRLKSLFA